LLLRDREFGNIKRFYTNEIGVFTRSVANSSINQTETDNFQYPRATTSVKSINGDGRYFTKKHHGGEAISISHPDVKVKHFAYGHSFATLLNPHGVTTVSHKYSLTVASHATVVTAVPSAVHHPIIYKIKIYYF
jgi:hypothetical protein